MNPSVSYPFSVLFLLLLILFLSSSFASRADDQDEDPFKSCEPFDCGGIKNISYPFRGNHQPEYCGHPEFVVDCKRDRHQPENCGPPRVVVDCEQDRGILVYEDGKKFRVVGINQTARVLTIARTDFGDFYCPKNFTNTTLSSTPFHYSKNDKNTTLLYDCDEIPGFSYLFGFPCDVNNVPRWAYFVPNEVIWRHGCRVSVMVPVMEGVLKGYVSGLYPFDHVLEGGFDVEWNITDEDKCEKCGGTGGRCGHDSSSTKNNSFMCFCPLHHPSDGFICRPPEEPVPEKSQKDANFTVCDLPYECGKVKNLSFPFWGDARPQSCGHPGFKLRCERGEYPVMDINKVEYRVLNVSKENSTMILARSDLWDSPCSPGPVNTTFTPPPFFNYTQGVVNLTLYYHCPKVDLFPYNFSCPGRDVGDNSYYLKGDFVNDNYPFLNELIGACGSFIQVPVFESALDEPPDQNGLEVVTRALGEGFGLNYTEFPRCRACEISGGRCGTIVDDGEKFCCYCRNGTEESICPLDTAEDANFTVCERPYECGDVKNLSFPFWGDGRPQSCGHPGFELRCERGEFPVMDINEVEYRVLNVSKENYSMTLARSDLWDSPCSPRPVNTTFTPPPFFNYTQGVVNLTLYYHCPRVDFFPYNLSCPGRDVGDNSYYLKGDNSPFLNELRGCGSFVQVPVFEAALDEPPDDDGRKDVTRALREGFGLNYPDFPCCRRCEISGGRCRTSDSGKTFYCFCRNGTQELCPLDTADKNVKLKIGIGVGCGLGGAIIMCVVLLLCFRMRRKREKNPPRSLLSRDISSHFSSVKDAEKGSTYFGVHLFGYEELVEATNNFDTSKELGDGGFGTVYYGKLQDGRVVAVKRLYENNFRRVEQFKNEIAILARLRHRNLVSLYGCTSRHSHELLLVYEYIPNGTVADHLHGQRAKPGALPWAIRLNIAIETACALTYLHASDIIHRDVKTNNILLDNNFSVKVADFGLSRLFPEHVTHISTAPQGTPGYVDPEYHQCYQLTSKSDVFSFGVVMMELVSSMPAVDITRHRHDINLSTMAMNRIQNHALHEIVDPNLGFDTDSRVRKMITAVAELAFQCLQHEKDLRPSMVDVLEELKAIQSREYSMERAEKIDAAADDAVLLMSGPHPLSPDSVVFQWESSTTTPNASS